MRVNKKESKTEKKWRETENLAALYLKREDILAGPHDFKGSFDGSDLVLGLGLELGLG